MMKKIIATAAQYPWLVLLLLGLITLAALFRLPELRVEITAEGMMVNNPNASSQYERTLQTFGSENVTVVFLEDPDLFAPSNLLAIRNALNDIESIPQVSRSVSLFSVRNLRTIDGYVYSTPYLKDIPQTPEEARNIIQSALINPLIERNLLSSDGSVMAINLYFDASSHQHGMDEQIAEALNAALAPLKQRLQRVFHLGDPSVRTGISEQIRADQKIILPLAMLVLVITLGVALGRANAALIPVCTAGLSVVWTLGLMASLDIPVNVMTSIVPALLIIVGSTEDIHLLSEYQAGIEKGMSKRPAISFMADHMGTAIALTFFTTFLGFLSISLNRIDLLQQFGMITAIGLALNFLITITLVPVCLVFMGHLQKGDPLVTGNYFSYLTGRMHAFTFRFPREISAAIAILFLVCCYWATQIKVNNTILDYFEPSSELPGQAKALSNKLSGMQSLSIVVSGNEGIFLQTPYLEELRDMQEYLTDNGNFDKSFSFADYIAVVHSGIDAQWPETVYLPERNAVVREYMSLLDHDNAKPFISPDFSQARIIVRHSVDSSSALNQAVADIKTYAEQWMDPALKVIVTGGSYLNSQAVDYMADGQARSLFLMLGVIFLLVTLLFMSLKAGLVAVIANLFPVVVLFGVMGFFGIALDTGTAMVGAIALGICVDHTMHFMVRYQRLVKNGFSEQQALSKVIEHESTPLIATALALAAGFATLTFSNFPPVTLFGILSALVMFLALIGTFVVIPLILRNTRLITVWDLLALHLKSEVLENCALFTGLRPWQIKKLTAMSRICEYQRNEAILEQGVKSDTMLVMLEGKAEALYTHQDGTTYEVDTYQPGQVFGVTALVSGRKQSSDVVALNRVRALLLSWRCIQGIAKIYPRIASKLYDNLACILGTRLFDDTQGKLYQDPLSGLQSAAYFHEVLGFLIAKANRYDKPLCLTMLSIQEVEAAGAGDGRRLLQEVAQTIKNDLRKVDFFARWRSGEFFLILPGQDQPHLQKVLVRIDHSLKKQNPSRGAGVNISVRWAYLNDGETVDRFIDRTKLQDIRMAIGGRADTVSALPQQHCSFRQS